jgi:DNA processing protein
MEIYYYLAFSYCLGIGPCKFKNLKQRFSNIRAAYEADKASLLPILGEKLTANFLRFRNSFNPKKELLKLNQLKIRVITQADPLFPSNLLQIPDPPICLYVKGEIEAYDFGRDLFMAVVGTRTPTFYGQQITQTLVKDLVSQQIVIVSGLALGIDAIAHLTALENNGRTIAVLGCGVNIIYPAENFHLYERICQFKGLIISEFPAAMPVAKGLFVARNRLISGLAQGVLVIEGSERSGSLITADYAGRQGKDVFAVPAPINSKMAQAPNLLLKQGAKLVTCIQDILEEYNRSLIPQTPTAKILPDLSPEEKVIYTLLQNYPLTVNDLANKAKLDLQLILKLLSFLELKGIIAKNKIGKYYLCD